MASLIKKKKKFNYGLVDLWTIDHKIMIIFQFDRFFIDKHEKLKKKSYLSFSFLSYNQ